MTLQQQVEQLAATQQMLMKRIARLEVAQKPAKEKRKSSYVPKIKITKPLTKAEIHQRIDARFSKKKNTK